MANTMANTIANATVTNETQLQIFNNAEFGSIRTLDINGEPWFVGKDVAGALGYSNTRDALAKHVDEEDKDSVAIHDGIPGNPNQTIINESGVYSLVFSSKLPTAKKFKRWVTSEVLPAIRKHGVYASNITDVMGTPLSREEFAKFAYILRLGIGDFAAEIKNEVSTLAAIIKEQNDTYNKNIFQLLDKFSQTQVGESPTVKRQIYKSQLLQTTPPEVKKLINKISVKYSLPYNRAAMKAYTEIERLAGCDLTKDVKSFAAANGCSRASKAYYVGARAKYLDILRQIAEEV